MRFVQLFTVVFLFSFSLLALFGLGSDPLMLDTPRLLSLAGLASLQALAVALLEAFSRKRRNGSRGGDTSSAFSA